MTTGAAAAYDVLVGHYRRGDLDVADAAGRRLLEVQPGHVGALQLLGVIEARRDRLEAALALFERAIAIEAGTASLHNNRGNVLLALERHAEAADAYERAVALGGENAQALNNRGAALQALKRFDAALASYERAIALDADCADALLNRGELLLELGRRDAAIESLQRARAAGADDAKVAFALASIGVEPPAPAPPDGFVRELFDGYAPNFDAHLTGRLGYRAPELVAQAVAGLVPPAAQIVDLGCGTGLSGVPLRALAARLDGVDLSERMLAHARARGLYDTIACAELVTWLGRRPARYDVAVAADVLNYLGALEPAFAAVHAALRGQGCFVFTVESDEAGMTRDYELRPTRRYVHARAYLERIAPRCGFVLRTLRGERLRRESQADVPGWLVVLQRS